MMKKTFRLLAMFVVALLATATIVSCDDDDDDWAGPYPSPNHTLAIVTEKTNPETGQAFMQLNDSVTIVPTNIKMWPTAKEIRAYVTYDLADSAAGHYSHAAYVYKVDTIRTKMMSPAVENMDKAYGNDPVEIVDSWETVCEDGYLTVRFRTYFGSDKVHSLYLVRTGDDTVELRHNTNGDTKGYVADGLIAFRLNDMPDTDGKYKPFTLKWKSFSGEKSVTFKYKTRL